MDVTGKLSRQAVEEFKKIYESEFSGVLADSDAEEMAIRLLRVVDLLMQPEPAQARETLPVIHC